MLKSTIIAALVSIGPNYCENKIADILKKVIDSGGVETKPNKPKPNKPICMSAIDKEILRQTNAYRKRGAKCGGASFKPAKPLLWDCELAKAAKSHSLDMYKKKMMSHTGSDGSSMTERVRRTAYQGRYLGENIAKGHQSVTIVMRAWMKSSGHCKNIMNQNYRHLGHGQTSRNWVQNFGG